MNIANELKEIVIKHPDKAAIKFPIKKILGGYTYSRMSFSELDETVNKYAASFESIGIKKGMKTVLFVKPCLEFTALVFALFKVGAIPILIDPGMGRKNLLAAIKLVRPEAMVAIPLVHILRFFFQDAFSSVKYAVTTGRFQFRKIQTTKKLLKKNLPYTDVRELDGNEMAAILFTSGGTGIPKGVVYTHKIFRTQTQILKKLFNLNPDEIDLPGFPLFSLFTVTMGMTSCIPDMNPAKPSKANPKKLVQNILDTKATFVAGSPAIWERVADYCVKKNIILPSIKYLVMFGAPVSNALHRKFSNVLTSGDTYTPYGATESLPVANISGGYVLKNTSIDTDNGKGTCVGDPVDNIEVKIIKISDNPIESFKDCELLENNQIGEIIVKGDVVTKEYFLMDEENKKAKILDGDTFWHRIGDLGYLDSQGKLWFCGRKTHRVEFKGELLCSVLCEAIFNQHPIVQKSALIGPLGKDCVVTPTIVIEMNDSIRQGNQNQIVSELKILASKYDHTKSIQEVEFYEKFPVDVRHNIKIDRIKIKEFFQKKNRENFL